MAQLATVQDYVDESRMLLQDRIVPYRYATADLVGALNLGLTEARRLRPDLFLALNFDVPSFTDTATNVTVPVDIMYRTPLVWYIVGRTQMRDEEPTVDSRAASFLAMFQKQLLSLS